MQEKFTEIASSAESLIKLDEIQSHAAEAAKLLRALSNESRLMILCALVGKEMCVSELNQKVGLSQSALSQHLAMLRRDNIVKTQRQSQTILYSLAQEHTTRIIEVLQDIYCPR